MNNAMNSDNDNPNSTEPEYEPQSPPAESADVPAGVHGRGAPSDVSVVGPAAHLENIRPVQPPVSEDLRVPWGWWDLGLLVVIAALGSLLLAFLIIAAFQTAGITRTVFEHSIKYQSVLSIMVVFLLSLFLLFYLALQLRIGFRVPFWSTLRWKAPEIGSVPPRVAYLGFILSGFLLSMFIALVSSAFSPKNKMPIEQFLEDRQTAFLLLVMSVTLAPLFEETIFRGYIYPVVARTFGVIPGVLFTGLLFGLMHASQLGGNLPQVALLAIVGIVFTAFRAKTGSVLPGYLVHVSYNSFISIAFLIASHGLRHMPPR